MDRSVAYLRRVRDYLRDTRDVSGTLEMLNKILSEPAAMESLRRSDGADGIPLDNVKLGVIPSGGTVTKPESRDNRDSKVRDTTPKSAYKPSDAEVYTRAAVGVAHSIGGVALTAFGGGGLVQPIGQLEGMALDAGFGSNK